VTTRPPVPPLAQAAASMACKEAIGFDWVARPTMASLPTAPLWVLTHYPGLT
jgi:hypothetical protein